MGFNFLANISHDIGGVLHGNSNPGGGVFGFLDKQLLPQNEQQKENQNVGENLIKGAANKIQHIPVIGRADTHILNAARDVGQGTLAAGVPLGVELYNRVEAPLLKLPKSQGVDPSQLGPIGPTLLGDKPIQSPSEVFSSARQGGHGLPFSFLAAGLSAGGAIPGGGAEDDVIKSLVKTETAEDAAKVLTKSGVDKDTAAAIAPTIAKTSDPTAISNIIQQIHPGDSHVPINTGVLKIPPGELKALQQASTPEQVKSIIGEALPAAAQDHIAPAIAATSDPNIIKNIFARELNAKAIPAEPEIKLPSAPPPGAAGPTTDGISGGTQRKFLETVQDANSTSEDLQAGARKLDQTYQAKNNQDLVDKANKAIGNDETGAIAHVLSVDKPTDEDVATAIALVKRAQAEGTPEAIQRAVNIVDTMDNKLREAGRTVQAASLYHTLSPEGILRLASRKIGAAREGNKNVIKEIPTAQDIQGTVEGVTPENSGAVRDIIGKTVKSIAEGQQKLKLGGIEGDHLTAEQEAAQNTGQKLAKRVDAAANPAVKKKADTLVNELTKLVKQEYLEPKNTVPRSPTHILQEVFGRNAEAHEAFPLAQQLLRKKYANVPAMQDALDKFFGAKLDIPAAGSTIKNAIREHLKLNEVNVIDAIHQSYSNQKQTVEDIAASLTKEGFDKESAAVLAKEVKTRLDAQFSEAKANTLQRLAQEAPKRAQPTYVQKLNKLSNLGALDSKDYLDLARAKLSLPNLDTETAGKLHELSQNLQDLPEGHDKYAAVREIQNLIGDQIPKTKGDLVKELVGLPRTIQASGDLSFGARQGLAYATSHPIRFAQAWTKQFAFFKEAFGGSDSQSFDAMMADIRNHPDYNLLEKSPLSLTEPTGHSTAVREEQFISSDLAEKIPALGRLIRGSNYAYTGLANMLRANEFYAQIAHLRYADVPIDQKLLDGIGEQINTATGRGGKVGGFVDQHGGFLSTALFSPRLIASRVNMMNPAYYIRLPGPARQEALRSLLGLSAFAGGVLGLAKLAGSQVSVDPRNADFGKIRVGDTRLDIMGGYTQYIRLGAELSTGQKINSTTGAETEAGKGFAGSRLDIANNFLQGKENPSVSFITSLLKGKDTSGNNLYTPKGVTSQVVQRFIPLLFQDMADLATHPNAAGGSTAGKVAAAGAGVFGIGLQTYGVGDETLTAKEQSYVKDLKQNNATPQTIQGASSFFQNLRIASGQRANYSSKINDALKSKDYNKAEQIATEYNQKLAQGMQSWAKQNSQYATPDLQEAYNKQKLNLTPTSIQQRIKGLESTKPF